MRVGRDRRLILLACSLILLPLLLAGDYLLLSVSLRALKSLTSRKVTAPAAEPAYPAGWWQRYRNDDDGYTLALPPDWQVVPLGNQEGSGDQASVAGRLAALARERAAAGLGTWVAVGPDGPLGATTSVNIIRQPLAKDLSVDAFAKANLMELRQGERPATDMQQRWLELSAGRVLCTTTSYTLPAGGSATSVEATQFYAVHGRSGYVVTAITRSDLAEAYAPIFEGIVRSLRWNE